MKILTALWEFALDLIIGDEPLIAALVVIGLGISLGFLATGLSTGLVAVIGAVIVATGFAVVVLVEVRRERTRGDL